MVFYSAYSSCERVHSYNKSGSPSYKPWKLINLPNGTKSFIIGDEVPVYEKIQSYKDDCDIKLIISRCLAREGSTESLKADPKKSLNYCLFPTDVKSYETFVRNTKALYDGLDPSVKAKFSSFSDFCDNTDVVSSFYEELLTKAKNKPHIDINVDKKEGDK